MTTPPPTESRYPEPDAEPPHAVPRPALAWGDDGTPRSVAFDDVYFSTADGLEETRAVFLAGCGLPQAWAGRPHFTIAELGFGTGLNALAALDLWRATRRPDQRLHLFSVEAFPLDRADAARALAAWPQLADLSRALIAQWPRRAPGFHRIDFPDVGAVLDLAIGEVGWALEQWRGQADAWFLDGFSPAKNPAMWREAVLAGVRRRSAPGARLATFTVAGAVRRGLEAQGFSVQRQPGHGRKRQRLEAVLPGEPAPPRSPGRIAIIGAGIAGAALARAILAQGHRPTVFEAQSPGAGASGNPAGLVAPALDAGGGARARFYAQAFARAVDLYGAMSPTPILQRGALQLAGTERDPARFRAVAASGLFDPDALALLTAAAADERLGLAAGRTALDFAQAVSVRPAVILEAWLGGAERQQAMVQSIEWRGAAWRLAGPDGETVAEVDTVCIAAGAGAGRLDQRLPFAPVRGQASWTNGRGLGQSAAWGGYAIEMEGGFLFGATHDRDCDDQEISLQDHHRNLALLAQIAPGLAAGLDAGRLEGRASVRAATPDRMPLAGALPGPPGLFVLGGLGSRGFVTAPLLAEHVAALADGSPSPLPADLEALIGPDKRL